VGDLIISRGNDLSIRVFDATNPEAVVGKPQFYSSRA
jgi:hypothetical protein